MGNLELEVADTEGKLVKVDAGFVILSEGVIHLG